VAAGLLISLLSLIAGLTEIVLYLLGNKLVPGWASIFAIMSFATGLNMFFLGVIGEYVGLIFDEVKGRPRYVIDKIFKQGGKSFTASISNAPSQSLSPTTLRQEQ
jgi:dolichol-phosphate mannosyltransferase